MKINDMRTIEQKDRGSFIAAASRTSLLILNKGVFNPKEKGGNSQRHM